MKNFAQKLRFWTFLVIAPLTASVSLHAQSSTNTLPPGFIKIAKDEFPFHGNLTSIDTQAGTIMVNQQTFQVTTNTIITRLGKRVTLADGAQGEVVAGSYRKGPDGKLQALGLRFAPRHRTQPSGSSTNMTTKAAAP